MSVTGESAASLVAGGSPNVPSSRKAPAPRARSVAVSRGPGGTGSPGTVDVEGGAGAGAGVAIAVRVAPDAAPGAAWLGSRRSVVAERRRCSITLISETMPVREGSRDCARCAASSAPEKSSSASIRRASAKFAS